MMRLKIVASAKKHPPQKPVEIRLQEHDQTTLARTNMTRRKFGTIAKGDQSQPIVNE
jgi:hypothetical protein